MKRFALSTVLALVASLFVGVPASWASLSLSYEFNTPGEVAANFNSYVSSGTIVQSTSGGIGGTGALNVSSNSANGVYATKTAFSIGPVGSTYTFTAYMQSVGNGGYSGMGFTSTVPSASNAGGGPFRPNDALGVSVHGGGFVFHDGSNPDANGAWGQSGVSNGITAVTSSTIGDLLNSGSTDKWYKVILKAERNTVSTFNLRVEVWPVRADGSLINSAGPSAVFDYLNRTATTLINAPVIYAYFNFSGNRVYYFDKFSVTLGGGASIVEPGFPVAVTTSASATGGALTFNGDVTADGGATITERGFAYGTSHDPTTAGTKVTASGTTGTYNATTSTVADGTYYVRAYATNANGTNYGAEFAITVSGGSGTGTVPADTGGGGGGGNTSDAFALSATKSGVAATQIASGDRIDVKVHAPIAHVGPATQTITSMWSGQSLAAAASGKYDASGNPDGIKYPDGWTLEYTTDGMNWTTTAPAIANIAGVRASGPVNSKGSGVFETTSSAEEVQTPGVFGGTSAGDGYNLAFGDGFVLNSWHHQASLNVECHTLDGTNCPVYVKTIAGYQTSMASSLYLDKKTNKVYEFVRKTATSEIGVYCLDYSRLDTGVVNSCTVPFTALGSNSTSFDWSGSGNSRDGSKLWSLNPATGNLLCFDITTNAACPTDNGANVGTASADTTDGKLRDRVTAWAGKVYFTVNDKFGCYDPSSHALCASSTPIAIPATVNTRSPRDGWNRHAPLPVYNTDGTFLGVCDINSQLCINDAGVTVTMPTGLDNYFSTAFYMNDIAGQNAAQWTISGNKFYYIGPGSASNPYSVPIEYWSSTILCWDFSTDAKCADWVANAPGIYLPYTVNIDPLNPGCVWVNQDIGWGGKPAGKIIPLNATTGQVGCAPANPSVKFSYETVVPQLSCAAEDRVTEWGNITLALGAIENTDVSLSVFDSEGNIIKGWDGVPVDGNGSVDLSTLPVADTGTTPSFRVNGLNATMEDLLTITADVTYNAGEPELCLPLDVRSKCPNVTADPTHPDVSDGIIKSDSLTVPNGGGDNVTAEDTLTLAGTNTGNVCASSLPGNPPNPPTNPTVSPGDGTATVSWNAPTEGSAPTSYTVTDESGLYSCTVNAPATSCEVTGLTNGYPYVFHVVATNPAGDSDPSTNTAAIIPAAPYVANTLTVYFTSIGSKLSPYAKTLITNFMNDHRFKKVTCTGSTQGLETIVWLAKSRAVNSCAFATGVKKVTTQSAITTNKGIRAPFRAVVLVGK